MNKPTKNRSCLTKSCFFFHLLTSSIPLSTNSLFFSLLFSVLLFFMHIEPFFKHTLDQWRNCFRIMIIGCISNFSERTNVRRAKLFWINYSILVEIAWIHRIDSIGFEFFFSSDLERKTNIQQNAFFEIQWVRGFLYEPGHWVQCTYTHYSSAHTHTRTYIINLWVCSLTKHSMLVLIFFSFFPFNIP